MKKVLLFSGVLLTIILAACSATETVTPQPGTDADESPVSPSEAADPTATSAPTPSATPEESTIRIWHAWDETYSPALVEIIAGFQVNNPGVYFDVLYIPRENLLERYIEATRTGDGPSLLLGPAEWGPILYDEELISDMNGLFSGELLARFSPPALEQGQYKSAQLGLPHSLQGVVIYRNRSIIPESADTFEDLLSLATSFTEGDTIGAVLERGFFYSGGHLYGIGGSLLGDDGLPEFNDVKGIEWVNLLQDFELTGATTYLSDRDLELFREGRVGIVIDGTWNLDDLAEAVGEQDLMIDPWPTYGDDALSGYVQSEHVFLNPNISDHNLEATLRFVEYFSSTEAQTILAGVGFIPAVTDLQLTGESRQRHLTQAIIALSGGSGYPVVPEMSIYPAYMDQALRSIFELGAVPQDALNAAEEAILREIEQMQETQSQEGG